MKVKVSACFVFVFLFRSVDVLGCLTSDPCTELPAAAL